MVCGNTFQTLHYVFRSIVALHSFKLKLRSVKRKVHCQSKTGRARELKGEQGTAELVANAVLKQTNELCF